MKLFTGFLRIMNSDHSGQVIDSIWKASIRHDGDALLSLRSAIITSEPPGAEFLPLGFSRLSTDLRESGLPDACLVSVRILKPLRYRSLRPPSYQRSSR